MIHMSSLEQHNQIKCVNTKYNSEALCC